MSLARANNYAGMPEPFRPKNPEFTIGYTMSCVIDKKANGKTDVFQWIEFTRPQFAHKVKDELIYGQALQPDWCKDVYRTKRVLHYLMERLNGHRLLYNELDDGKPKNKKARKSVDIAAKYDYIRAKAMNLSTLNLEIAEWAEQEINDEASPLHGQSQQHIEHLIVQLQRAKIAAKTISPKHLSLRDLAGWYLDFAIAPCVGKFQKETFLFGGEAGVGKSMAAKLLGMYLSEMIIEIDELTDVDPSIRVTNAFEHLRFENGRKDRSEVYDDGAYEEEKPEKLKAYHDNTEEESKTVERYTVATFDGHGCRIACVNPYDEEAEKPTSEYHGLEAVKYATFFNMMRPAFNEKMNEKHIEAVFKRTNIILHTRKFVYFRRAGEKKLPVPRIKYPVPSPDIFIGSVHCKARQGALKFGMNHVEAPKEDQEWGRRYIRICLAGNTPPKRRKIAESVGGITKDVEIKPEITVDLQQGPDFPREPLLGIKFEHKEAVETALASFEVPDLDVAAAAAPAAVEAPSLFSEIVAEAWDALNAAGEEDPFGHGGGMDVGMDVD